MKKRKLTLNEEVRQIKGMMGIFLENKEMFQNRALDKINKVGGFDKLSDLDKLALLGGSDDKRLRSLSLINIYKENGGTFGFLQIKVRVKDIGEQHIDHEFSKEMAGKEGYLYPYINNDSDDSRPYVTVRFDTFTSDSELYGGGQYESRPIMLANLYPIDYDEIKGDFVNYQKKVDQERDAFKTGWDGLWDEEPNI
jgi:hypothetical protein